MYIIYPIQKDTYITNKKLNGVDGKNSNFGKSATLDLFKTYNENIDIQSNCLFRLNDIPDENELIEFENTFNQTIQILIDINITNDDNINGTTNIDNQYVIGILGLTSVSEIVDHIQLTLNNLKTEIGVNIYTHSPTGLFSIEQQTKGVVGDKNIILQENSKFELLRDFSRVEESIILLKADLPADNEYFYYPVVQDKIKVYLELHDITTSLSKPRDYTVEALPLTKDFNEGLGRDVYSLTDIDTANWLYCNYNGNTNEKIEWETAGKIGLIEGTDPNNCDLLTSADGYDFKSENACQKYIADGDENIIIDVTPIYEKYWGVNSIPDKGIAIKFTNQVLWDDETYFAKRLGARNLRNRHMRSCLKILIDDEAYNIPIQKDFYFNDNSKIFLYNKKGNKLKNIQKLDNNNQIVDISTGENNNGLGDIRLKVESVAVDGNIPIYSVAGWNVKQAKDIKGHNIVGTYYTDEFNINTLLNTDLNVWMFENNVSSMDFNFIWYWHSDETIIYQETKTFYNDTITTDNTFKRLRASVKLYSPDLGIMDEIHKIAVTFFDIDGQYDYVKVKRALQGLDVGDVFYEVIDYDTNEILIPATEEMNATKCLKEKDYYWFPFFNSDVFYGRRIQFIFKLKQQEQNNLIVNANEVFRIGNNG